MKKLLYLVIIALALTACTSKERKAEILIKEKMLKTLYNAESYDPVETVVDSAFTPFDDPKFYEKTLAIAEIGWEMERYESEAKSAERQIALYQDLLRISYSNSNKLSLNQAQEEYDNILAKKSEAEEKAKDLAEQLKADLQQKPLFIGFKSRHRYRAKDNEGNTFMGEAKFLFDKDITQIVCVWDMDGYEYKQVQDLYKYIQEKKNH